MQSRLQQRPNSAWVEALRGEGKDAAQRVEELAGYVRRILTSTLSGRRLSDEALADLAQEAMAQMLGSLHTFRGDSAFPTWAAAVATRVAFTELRRAAARDAGHAAFREAHRDALESTEPADQGMDDGTRTKVFSALHAAIDADLTSKQRIATLALLRGVPTIEIADQLDSNPNAVYKLVHDARLRLRDALARRGVTAELIEEVVEGGRAQ